jgi:tetratricopeptide (TPR) repeat protein
MWVIAAILFLVLVSALGLWQMRQRPYIAAGWFWYLGMLIPVLGLIQVGSQSMADRYTYLPTIGLAAALVWASAAWSERRPHILQVIPWGTAALLIGLAAMARHQVHYWKDSITLFEHAVAVTPENFMTQFYLGNALLEKGDMTRGVATMERVLELNPGFANAHTSLAYAYAMGGKPAQTISHYRSALQLRPDWADPMNNLAWLLATAKDPSIRDGKEAVKLAERAAELTGHNQPRILGTLAAAYAETGDFQRAIETAERARALATATGLKSVADRNSELIEFYKAGKPFRDQ